MTEAGQHTRMVLELYRGQLTSVRKQRERVKELRRSVYRTQSLSNGHGSAAVSREPEQKVFRLESERRRLWHMETILMSRRVMVERYLDTIQDPAVRFILYLRYIDGLSWKQIAVRHGCGASEDAMRKAAVRYMDRNPL